MAGHNLSLPTFYPISNVTIGDYSSIRIDSEWKALLKAAEEGHEISLRIKGVDIERARVEKENGSRVYICHDHSSRDGRHGPRLGFQYSWQVERGQNCGEIETIIIIDPKETERRRAKEQKEREKAEAEERKKQAAENEKLKGKFDSCLDRVVLPVEVRVDILSVLRQALNQSKIFDDWGLKETISYGLGMTFLFWGGPGTGKTLTAKSIADGLGKELHILDAAQTQSSEPGHAERAFAEAFQKAKEKKAVLLLDECDSFIGSRQNLGMILSAEVNALLQEIEKFDGILILTTNRIGDLDEALERRISLIVEYKDPSPEQRLQIFKTIIPEKMPLNEVRLEEIANDYPLTGGQIKNVILNAARLAAAEELPHVHHDHFIRAIKRILSSRGRFQQNKGLAMGGGYTKVRS